MQEARGFRTAFVLVTILLGSAVSVRADLSNGNFETSSDASWALVSADISFGVATLWEDTASYGDYPGDPAYSSISQTFEVDDDGMRLQFDFGIVPSGGEPETDHFQVVLNGTVYGIASTDATDPLNDGKWHRGYISPAIPVLPTGSNILTFLLEGHNDGYDTSIKIDNVSLVGSVVPVPGALLLGSLGLTCAGWQLRRRVT